MGVFFFTYSFDMWVSDLSPCDDLFSHIAFGKSPKHIQYHIILTFYGRSSSFFHAKQEKPNMHHQFLITLYRNLLG